MRRPLINVVRCWLWEDWDDFINKYGPNTNPNDYCEFNALLGYYEGIGVLVIKGSIDIQLVSDLIVGDIIHLYNTIVQIIMERRKVDSMEKVYEGIEYLYKKIMAFQQQ